MSLSSRSLWITLSLSLLACGFPKSGAAPGPVSPATLEAAKSRWPDASEASLDAGRSLFLARCNGCHSYPDLASIPEAKWPSIMDEMAPKAKLNPEQKDVVLHYVTVARVDQTGAK